jgi:septal ring factor EnvC (AmiA/AmiB activator)
MGDNKNMDSMIEFVQALNIPQLVLIALMLYGFFKEFRNSINERFEQIDKRFEQIDKRFEQIDKRFEQIDKRFDRLEERVDRLDERINKVEEKLDMKISTLYMMLFKTSIDDVCKPKTKKQK